MSGKEPTFFGSYPPQLPVQEFDGIWLPTIAIHLQDPLAISQIKDSIETARDNAGLGGLGDDGEHDDGSNRHVFPVVTRDQEATLLAILTRYGDRTRFWDGIARGTTPEARVLKSIALTASKLEQQIAQLAGLDPALADAKAFDRGSIIVSALADIAASLDQFDEGSRTLAAELRGRLLDRRQALRTAVPRRYADVLGALRPLAANPRNVRDVGENQLNEPVLELVINLTVWWKEVTGAEPVFSNKAKGEAELGKSSPYLVFIENVLRQLPEDIAPRKSRGRFGIGRDALARHWKSYSERRHGGYL